MQKTADLRLGGHDVEQPPVVGRRFGRTEPDAEISVDSGHGMDQLTEAPSGVGVGAGVDAGQHEFGESVRDRSAAVGQDFVERARPLRPARIRDDAVTAEIVAPLLNFQKRPAAERKTAERPFPERRYRLLAAAGRAAGIGPAGQVFEHELRQGPLFGVRQHDIGRAVGQERIAVELRAAAGDDDDRLGMGRAELPHRLSAVTVQLLTTASAAFSADSATSYPASARRETSNALSAVLSRQPSVRTIALRFKITLPFLRVT